MKTKNRILLLFFILLISRSDYVYGQEPWHWEQPVTLKDHTDTPDFAVDRNNGHLHIITMALVGGVFYTETDSAGNIIIDAENVPIVYGSPESNVRDVGGYYFGATIAVDQEGYPHICYRVHLEEQWRFNLYYIRKTSSGWSASKLIASNVWRGNIVRMAIGGDNRVHIIQSSVADNLEDITPAPPWGKVYYYQVYNGNLQGSLTKTISDPVKFGELRYRVDNRFEIDAAENGDVHLVLGYPFHNSSAGIYGKITYFYSTDHGNSFTKFGQIQSSDCLARNGCPDIFLDRVGDVHLCYGTHKDFGLNNEKSLRYVKISGNEIVEHNIVNPRGSMTDCDRWGLGSVAASDGGQYVAASYLTKNGGKLKVRLSSDGGKNWDSPISISNSCGGQDGRNKHLLRAYKNNFYLVYPHNFSSTTHAVRLTTLLNVGDYAPVANAGGPYTGDEGESIYLNMSASSDSGMYAGIVEYAWDWDQDQVFDFITASSEVYYEFPDNFEGDAVLRVTDRIGQTSYDTTAIHIFNVPPQVNAGDDINCEEGDTLKFSSIIEDPGEDVIDINWDFGDGNTSVNYEPTHSYPDEGEFTVVVTVSDDDGGEDKDSLTVTVLNADPWVDAGGPYNGAAESEIEISGTAHDKGIYDTMQYRWDLDDDGIYETHGIETVVSFKKYGQHTIWFQAIDNDGGVGIDSALVNISQESPFITFMPNQVINEGESFEPVHLDDHVIDLDHTPDQMTWNYFGGDDLNILITERILYVTVPDSEWAGMRKITLFVSDPLDMKDSCDVSFTVLPVNDRPIWTGLDKFNFNEDDSLKIQFSYFYDHVIDVDDDFDNLTFEIQNNQKIQWFTDYQNKHLTLFAETNWYGIEELGFCVIDTAGAYDLIVSEVKVKDMQDLPNPFYLIEPIYKIFSEWPESINCVWHSTTDPDSGSHVFYEWMLKYQGGSLIEKKPLIDTAYCYICDSTLTSGTYIWEVVAYDEFRNGRVSENKGLFILEGSGVDDSGITVPDDYRLLQNYPNPFNPQTMITFHLPEHNHVCVKIYNQLGQLVNTLLDEERNGGIHSLIWRGEDINGRKVPAGVYFCRLKAGDRIFLKKMVIVQ